MEIASTQMQVSIEVGKKAQNTEAQLVNDLMTKSLEATNQMAAQQRANQGVGTQLDVVV